MPAKCAAPTSAKNWQSDAHGPGGQFSCLAFSFLLFFCGQWSRESYVAWVCFFACS